MPRLLYRLTLVFAASCLDISAQAQSTAPSTLSPPPGTLGRLPLAATAPSPATPPAYVRPGNDIGTGQSLPTSNQSSNIAPGDTRSTIAPRLPAPSVGENAPPRAFLTAARNSLASGRTGEAQEALERAESRALDRSVAIGAGNAPSRQPLVAQIAAARGALAGGDRSRALQLVEDAIRSPDSGDVSR